MALLPLSLFAGALLCPAPAQAQSTPAPQMRQPSPAEQDADRLFNEGNRLMARGAHEEACPKFEKSQELDPGVGTQFNLANCYELTNRPARAYNLFREVERTAGSSGLQARSDAARQRAADLWPKVPRLHFVTEARSHNLHDSLDLKVDGASLAKPDDPVLVDPGPHRVTASAAGKRPWTSTVTVTRDTRVLDVPVPPLEDDPRAATAPPEPVVPSAGKDELVPSSAPVPARTDANTWPLQRTLAIVAVGAGVAGIGVGTYFGLASKSDHDDAQGLCP
ncbi:MAG TPA: hypothetical protein VNO21_01345, partial [Polyangiaceae bacterium]|nr:hypothetical protein [Polyangiaceae bacterium]